MLSSKGFFLTQGDGLEGVNWVAWKDDCRVELAVLSPLGWHQSAMAARSPEQALAYIYKGEIFEAQPVTRTKLDYYWHKVANYFGSFPQAPVFSVALSDTCPMNMEQVAEYLP
jgi:hypothetical protein